MIVLLIIWKTNSNGDLAPTAEAIEEWKWCASQGNNKITDIALKNVLNVPEIGNNEIYISERLPYKISIKSTELFMGYIEKSMYILIETRLYYRSLWLGTSVGSLH